LFNPEQGVRLVRIVAVKVEEDFILALEIRGWLPG
jgi:hypothetical protein